MDNKFQQGVLPIDLLPPGHAVYQRISVDGGKTEETSFVVCELASYIADLPKNIPMHVRAGCAEYNGVHMVIILIQAAESLYEIYFNFYQPSDDGMAVVDDLARQAVLHMFFLEPHNPMPLKGVRFINPMRQFFQQLQAQAPDWAPWSMAEFDDAKQYVVNRWSLEELWTMFGNIAQREDMVGAVN